MQCHVTAKHRPSAWPAWKFDRVTTFAEYAEAGIEHYWIVDLEPPITLTAFRLVEGEYENVGESAGTMTGYMADAPITHDLEALVTRRAQRL